MRRFLRRVSLAWLFAVIIYLFQCHMLFVSMTMEHDPDYRTLNPTHLNNMSGARSTENVTDSGSDNVGIGLSVGKSVPSAAFHTFTGFSLGYLFLSSFLTILIYVLN